MDIEKARLCCLSLPLATEDFPFDETTLVLRVMNKMFACLDLERPDRITLKCEPEYALELRERYTGIEGAWHFNKKYWNSVSFDGSVPDELIESLIRHSYDEVVKKFTRKLKQEYELHL